MDTSRVVDVGEVAVEEEAERIAEAIGVSSTSFDSDRGSYHMSSNFEQIVFTGILWETSGSGEMDRLRKRNRESRQENLLFSLAAWKDISEKEKEERKKAWKIYTALNNRKYITLQSTVCKVIEKIAGMKKDMVRLVRISKERGPIIPRQTIGAHRRTLEDVVKSIKKIDRDFCLPQTDGNTIHYRDILSMMTNCYRYGIERIWQREGKICWITKEIILEHEGLEVSFGKYKVIWDLAEDSRNVGIRIEPEGKPVIPKREGHENLIHPHVSNNKICTGDSGVVLDNRMREGDLISVCTIIMAILTTYNVDGPYLELEQWESGIRCNKCKRFIHEEDVKEELKECIDCHTVICSHCAVSCTCEPETSKTNANEIGEVKCSTCFRTAVLPCTICLQKKEITIEDVKCQVHLDEKMKGKTRCKRCNRHICSSHTRICANCGGKSCTECIRVVKGLEGNKRSRVCLYCGKLCGWDIVTYEKRR